MRSIFRNILLMCTMLLAACTGRYASLENTMGACGYSKAPFSKFHECMANKVVVNEKGPKDYYYKSNKEILALLDTCQTGIKKKKLKEKAAYEKFGNYVAEKKIEEAKSQQTAGLIMAVALVGVAGAACANNGGCLGGGNSYAPYSGPCACPGDIASDGTRCGARSAYSRAGGASPYCPPYRM